MYGLTHTCIYISDTSIFANVINQRVQSYLYVFDGIEVYSTNLKHDDYWLNFQKLVQVYNLFRVTYQCSHASIEQMIRPQRGLHATVPYFICYVTMVAWRSVEGWVTWAVIT